MGGIVGGMFGMAGGAISAEGNKKNIEGQNAILQNAAHKIEGAGAEFYNRALQFQARADQEVDRAQSRTDYISGLRKNVYGSLGDPKYWDTTGEYGGDVGGQRFADISSVNTPFGALDKSYLLSNPETYIDVKQTLGTDGKTKTPVFSLKDKATGKVLQDNISLADAEKYGLGKAVTLSYSEKPGKRNQADKTLTFSPDDPKSLKKYGQIVSKAAKGKVADIKVQGGEGNLRDYINKDQYDELKKKELLETEQGKMAGRETAIAGGLLKGAMGEADPIWNKLLGNTVTASVEQNAALNRMTQRAWSNEMARGGTARRAYVESMQKAETARQISEVHRDQVREAVQNLTVFSINNAKNQMAWNQAWITGEGMGDMSASYQGLKLSLDTFWSTHIMPQMLAASETDLNANIQAAGLLAQRTSTAGMMQKFAGGIMSSLGGMASMGGGGGGMMGGS